MYMTVQRLSSTEFRKAYPRLDSPVEVTALGRPIGTWLPAGGTVTTPSAADADPQAIAAAPTGTPPLRVPKGGTNEAYRKVAATYKGR